MLVLRPGALGDTLLAVPALRALRRACAPITLAAHGPAARLLAQLGEVDRGIAFDDASLLSVLSTDREASAEPVVAWMSREFAPPNARVVAASRPPRMDRHAARYLLETLEPLGIDVRWDDTPLRVRAFPSDEILIHPGSGSAAKNWPADRFAELVTILDGPVRLVIGEADVDIAAQLETCLGRRLPRLEQPVLDELAARLAGCHAYVGNDSGVSHLAGLCGARSVAIFGPSDSRVWRPIGPRVYIAEFEDSAGRIAELLD